MQTEKEKLLVFVMQSLKPALSQFSINPSPSYVILGN